MTSATTSKKKSRGAAAPTGVPDDYLDLVRRFPLRPIRTRDDHHRALAVLDELLAHGETDRLSAGERDYASVLTRLVRAYDEEHSSLLRDRATRGKPSPVEALKFLMEENGMNTVALGKLVGGSGQASLILNGKRELSKANIRTLADRFRVSPALFL